MNTFILRWNPAISSYKMDGHKRLCKEIKKAKPLFLDWSVYEWQKLKVGDAFVLLQVGTENDGVAIIGKFISDAYEGDSWRKDGTKIHFADMQIFDAFDLEKDAAFRAVHFEKQFPQIKWHGGHSGEMLDNEVAENLIAEIDLRLKTVQGEKQNGFSFFLKNDKRFLPLDFLSKKDEILTLLSPFDFSIHTDKEEGYCEWLEEDELAIEVHNSDSEKEINIVVEYDYLNFSFSGWSQSYDATEYEYGVFLERLTGILKNELCILTAFRPKKLRKNQKNVTYEEVVWGISEKQFTKDSDKMKIFNEFALMQDEFPDIKKITVTYWDAARSFEVNID